MEGDVDPLRDMQIIQKELQLKDIEWVEKSLDTARKSGRALGTSSLAGRQRAEEIVSLSSSPAGRLLVNLLQGYTRTYIETFERGRQGCQERRLEQQRGRCIHSFTFPSHGTTFIPFK